MSEKKLIEKNLSLSIIIPTLNSARTLNECLASIRSQNYPYGQVEIILLDEGSTDETLKIAEKHKCRIITGYKGNQEARRHIGLHEAKHAIIGHIDSDNILPHKEWLKKMIQPFVDDEKVVGTQVYRYGIKKGFGLENRYFALTGVNDPVALYLDKNEKLPWIQKKWTKGAIIKENHSYTIVEFSPKNLPTMGSNGFFVKKDILLKFSWKPEEYFHIDIVFDLVKEGYSRFAMVNDLIYHDTATDLATLGKRRVKYFIEYNPVLTKRRYLLFDPTQKKDVVKLVLFIFYTLTLVQPILYAIRGFVKKPDVAWFLHPIVCWMFLTAYAYAFFKLSISSRIRN